MLKVNIGVEMLLFALQRFSTCQTVIHMNYNSSTADSDIALLTMAGKSKHTPIAMLNESSSFDIFGGSLSGFARKSLFIVKALGWGETETGEVSNDLQQLALKLIGNQECSMLLSKKCSKKSCTVSVSESMLCALRRGADVCKGERHIL